MLWQGRDSCTSFRSKMENPVKVKKRVREELVVIEHSEEEGEGAKWVTHYCSDHQILLVGEGDFSFSLCLAKSFGSASNMVASSLDTYDDVIKKYKHAKSNLDELQKLGAYLLHGVDATKMKFHSDLQMRRFDRVIFNFPHAGFHGKEDNLLLIKMHKDLVFGFFKNASCLLRANGEIHVNHKTTPPFSYWNIEELAMQSCLMLIECADFKKEDYPGYNNKRGDSIRCDLPFPLGKCSTFKFIYNPRIRKNHFRRNNHMELSRQQTILPFQEIQKVEQFPAQVDLNYFPQTSLFPKLNEPGISGFELRIRNGVTNGYAPIPRDLTNGYTSISRDYFNNVTETHGRVPSSADYYARDMVPNTQRLLQPMESLQSLQPWRTSSSYRYSLADPNRRTMDIAPPLPLGSRNEGYQVFGGSSSYLQEALQNAERSCYCFDGPRPDFERYRYNADLPGRTLNGGIYVQNELLQSRHTILMP